MSKNDRCWIDKVIEIFDEAREKRDAEKKGLGEKGGSDGRQ